jgi:hypothetical protein
VSRSGAAAAKDRNLLEMQVASSIFLSLLPAEIRLMIDTLLIPNVHTFRLAYWRIAIPLAGPRFRGLLHEWSRKKDVTTVLFSVHQTCHHGAVTMLYSQSKFIYCGH